MAEASDLPSAIRAVSADKADIVLADSRIAGLGSESARVGLVQLSRQAPVIVTGMTDPRFYTAPLQAAGAAGYWPKDGDLAQLTELLAAVAATTSPAPQRQRRPALAQTELTIGDDRIRWAVEQSQAAWHNISVSATQTGLSPPLALEAQLRRSP